MLNHRVTLDVFDLHARTLIDGQETSPDRRPAETRSRTLENTTHAQESREHSTGGAVGDGVAAGFGQVGDPETQAAVTRPSRHRGKAGGLGPPEGEQTAGGPEGRG